MSSHNSATSPQHLVAHWVATTKRQHQCYFLVSSLPWAMLCFALLQLFSHFYYLNFALSIACIVSIYIVGISSTHYKNINATNLLLHLNRHYPQLEESAQLIASDENTRSILVQIQRQKIAKQILLLGENPRNLPHKRFVKVGVFSTMMVIVLLLTQAPIRIVFDWRTNTNLNPQPVEKTNIDNADNIIPIQIKNSSITIEPPAYTMHKTHVTNDLNITIVEGSNVTWSIEIADPTVNYTIHFADNIQHSMSISSANILSFKQIVRSSSVYYFAANGQRISDIYSIAVTKDNPPTVRILTPFATITEFSKNQMPIAIAKVHIDDDFGVSEVKIIASVAKGSGEAVKFRDVTFEFDELIQQNNRNIYIKTWALQDLDMAPGDEFYFSVLVSDNRAINHSNEENGVLSAQQTRSETKIFRWLDDDEQLSMANGSLVSFVPEYFKSQRQIIIETQALIADKTILSAHDFEQTSRSLGYSQSDLKQKYGQFLGDEFDDGSGGNESPRSDHSDTHEHENKTPSVDVKDGDHSDDHTKEDIESTIALGSLSATHGHHHASENEQQSNDKSGYDAVIQQYGHMHGDTDIGVIGTQSPKAQMKIAVANMWQAELHLLLSEPEKALPYEQIALTYLNLARKAERIYVKRLGFEPPPVTEKRRYTGDLSDIYNYESNQNVISNHKDVKDLKHLLQALHRLNNNETLTAELTDAIISTKRQFTDLASNRPAMITHVATLEKLLIANSLVLPSCNTCITQLKQVIWQILPRPIAPPTTRELDYFNEEPMIQHYNKRLLSYPESDK